MNINKPEVVVVAFEQCLDIHGPDFPKTPTPVIEPVEAKPVSWDGPHDQKNPRNWSASRKWLVMSVNEIIAANVYVLRVTSSTVAS